LEDTYHARSINKFTNAHTNTYTSPDQRAFFVGVTKTLPSTQTFTAADAPVVDDSKVQPQCAAIVTEWQGE